MTQEALKLALDALETELSIDWTNNDEFNTSAEKMYEAIAAIKKALAQEQEAVGYWKEHAQGMQRDYDSLLADYEKLAQPAQEHDNSAIHLAHCYQGEYPVCKYGDENCPATPKVKTQPAQEQEPACPECKAGVLYECVACSSSNYPAKPEQEPWCMKMNGCKTKCEDCPVEAAQPEQEPVADDFFRMIADRNPKPFPLPQRTWVGLTDVEIDYLLGSTVGENEETHISFARAIESKLKELNT